MIVAARSSDRSSRKEPLTARPMGERAVATITASLGFKATTPCYCRVPPKARVDLGFRHTNRDQTMCITPRSTRGFGRLLVDGGGEVRGGGEGREERVRQHPVPIG